MRILHCIPSLEGGGAERQLSLLAPELVRLGHEVHIAYLSGTLNRARHEASGVGLHPLVHRGNYDPRIATQVLGLIRRFRPDVVQTWIIQMDVMAGLAAILSRTPWILREPNSAAAYSGNWKHRLRKGLARSASAVVANSAAGELYWRATHPGLRRFVVPNAIPLEEIDKSRASEPKEVLDAAQGFVLYAGRLEPHQKNLDNLLLAMREVLNAAPVGFVICGQGPHREAIDAFARAQGMADRVQMKGYSPEIWSYMKAAKLFVSVSRFEGRPNTVLEAMACGCPVVVSDIPEHREILDESSALLVDPHDPSAMARSVLEILRQPEAATRRAAEARRRAEQWSIPSMAAQYERVYREVLTRSVPPQSA